MLGAVQLVKHKSCNELTTNTFDFVNAFFYFAVGTLKSKVHWSSNTWKLEILLVIIFNLILLAAALRHKKLFTTTDLKRTLIKH